METGIDSPGISLSGKSQKTGSRNGKGVMDITFRIANYKIRDTRIPAAFHGTRFAVFGDMHGRCFGKEQERLFRAVEKIAPDYVLSTGDLITACRPASLKAAYVLLRRLAGRYPVYYAPGNHEQKFQEETEEGGRLFKNYLEGLTRAGVIYLDNRHVCIKRDGQEIGISGLRLPLEFYTKFWNRTVCDVKDIQKQLPVQRDAAFQILLAHNPLYTDAYIKWGAGLVLCGHIHGGIVRLPGLGGVISPTFELFPRYDSGSYRYGDGKQASVEPLEHTEKGMGRGTMLLTRGLWTHTIPIRIGNPPEIMVVELAG